MCPTLTADDALVVLAAGSAPSVHNSQPWQFAIDGSHLLLSADPDRVLCLSDPTARALYISRGAAVFSARVALRALGYQPRVRLLPHPEYPFMVLAVIDAASGSPPTAAERELYEALWRRRTNRRPFSDKPVPQAVFAKLRQAAKQEHASLRVLDRRDATRVLTLARAAGQQLSADVAHQAELRRWIAPREAGLPADEQPYGIPVDALPCGPARRYSMSFW